MTQQMQNPGQPAAPYVPPPPDAMMDCLGEWERFLHDRETHRGTPWQLVATRVDGVLRIPAEFVQDGAVVKGLPSTIRLLSDAGFLAERSFFWLFVGDAITSLGYGIIALLFLPHGLRAARVEERFGEAIIVATRDRRYVTFLAATLCVTLVDFQMGSTFALYVQSQGFSTAKYGMLISCNGLMIIVLELFITSWTQRARRMRHAPKARPT